MSKKNDNIKKLFICCEEFKELVDHLGNDIIDFKFRKCPFCGSNVVDNLTWWKDDENPIFEGDFTRCPDFVHKMFSHMRSHDSTFNWEFYIKNRVLLHFTFDYNLKDLDSPDWFGFKVFFKNISNYTTFEYCYLDNSDILDLGIVIEEILSHISSDTELYTEQLKLLKELKYDQCYDELNELKSYINKDIKKLKKADKSVDRFIEKCNKVFDALPNDVRLLLEVGE